MFRSGVRQNRLDHVVILSHFAVKSVQNFVLWNFFHFKPLPLAAPELLKTCKVHNGHQSLGFEGGQSTKPCSPLAMLTIWNLPLASLGPPKLGLAPPN